MTLEEVKDEEAAVKLKGHQGRVYVLVGCAYIVEEARKEVSLVK